MMLLANVSVKLWILNIFAEKNVKSYTHVFFIKNTWELDIVLTRTVNNFTTNELVKLTTLWTTAPSTFQLKRHLIWRYGFNKLRVEVWHTSQPIMVMSSTVSLPNHTFSWAGLVLLATNLYLCTFFHHKLTTALLESAKVKYFVFRRKYFIINLHKRTCRIGKDQPCDLLITSKTGIWLRHWDYRALNQSTLSIQTDPRPRSDAVEWSGSTLSLIQQYSRHINS